MCSTTPRVGPTPAGSYRRRPPEAGGATFEIEAGDDAAPAAPTRYWQRSIRSPSLKLTEAPSRYMDWTKNG